MIRYILRILKGVNTMEKAMIKKIVIVLSVIVLTIVLALGCNYLTRDDDDPMIDNADESFLNLGNINITHGDVYERTKSLEGINHLLNYIDEALLETHINTITEAQVEDELNLIKYNTTDPDEIAEIEADVEQMEQIEEQFYYTITYAGFDPEKPEEINRYIRLNLAKKLATREQLFEDFESESDTDLDAAVESYYQENERGQVRAIELVFQNAEEFEAVMNHFNLVPNFEGGIGLYHGSEPIEDVSREDITLTNTDVLPQETVFDYYVSMYNYLYQYRDQISELSKPDHLSAFSADYFKFDYETMIASDRSQGVADILYNQLSVDDADEESLNYTVDKRQYNQEDEAVSDYYVMYYKLGQTDPISYDDLSTSRKSDLQEAYFDQLVTDELVYSFMIELRQDHDLVIHDSQLHNSYEQMVSQAVGPEYAVYENIDNNTLATLDDFTVDADDFFEYAIRRIGALTVLEMYKEEFLLDSSYYTDRFGSSRKILTSNNENLEEHREFIENLKLQFSNHQYSQMYSWDEFLYLFYGYQNDEDFVRDLVITDLQNYLIPDYIDYDDAHDYVIEQDENYINMRVEHLLVFVDFDGDLSPDDYEEFLAGLDASEETEYTLKKAELETALIDAAEDTGTLSDVVDEYNEALRDETDPDNPWAEFKNYGFKVRHENLSADGNAITYNRTKTFVDNFTSNLYRIYETYLTSEYIDDDNLLDDRIFTTEFGMHLVKARQAAENFEAPSAQFTDTENAYDDRVENTNDIPNKDQLELWVDAQFDRMINGETSIELPESVEIAINAYFGSYFNGLLPNSEEDFDPFGNLVMINELLDADATFAKENDRIQAMLRALRDVYQMIIFGD